MRRYFWLASAVIVAGAAVTWFFARFDPCDTSIDRVVPSPDGSRALIVFHRDCGATVDFNTQISLAPSVRKFSFDGYPPFFSMSGRYALSVAWLSGSRIRIAIPKSEKIFRRANEIEGLSVTYR